LAKIFRHTKIFHLYNLKPILIKFLGKVIFMTYDEEKKSNSVLWVFFGIIGFIAIYYPLFGGNLRYTTGAFFSNIFHTIGIVCCTLGVLIIVWGFLILICTKSMKAISLMLFGFVLILIGSFWLEPGTMGTITHGEAVPRGYH